jgi:hypothetical protein
MAFPGNTSAVIFEAILNRTPVAPMRLNTKLSLELEQVINKLLEKEPDKRYQTAARLRADLQQLKRDSDSGRAPTAAAARTEKSVAVLYFENLSGAKEDEYFRDGMTEDVITELSKINGLRAFPRLAVLGFRDRSCKRLWLCVPTIPTSFTMPLVPMASFRGKPTLWRYSRKRRKLGTTICGGWPRTPTFRACSATRHFRSWSNPLI